MTKVTTTTVVLVDYNKPSITINRYETTASVVPRQGDYVNIASYERPIVQTYIVMGRSFSFNGSSQLIEVHIKLQ